MNVKNNITIYGNLVKDPDYKKGKKDKKSVVRLTVAVPRAYKNEDGDYDADFFNCSAFGTTADFIDDYFSKGDRILISGEMRNNTYEKDGVTVYAMELIVESVAFGSKKGDKE